MKLLPIGGRVYHFLRRQLKAPWARFATVTDPRDRRGQRWSLLPMMHDLGGILAGVKTLRQLEAQSLDLQMPGFSPLHRRLPDTTVYELLGRLAPDELLGTLVAQVRTLWRSKLLAPLGLPCGVIAIDGKSLGALDHDADGWGQRHTRDHDGSPYWLVRALRAVLTSSVGRPALWQLPIPPHTNEMGCFVAMFDALRTSYDALFEIITVDAGMTSKRARGVCAGGGQGLRHGRQGRSARAAAGASARADAADGSGPCSTQRLGAAQGDTACSVDCTAPSSWQGCPAGSRCARGGWSAPRIAPTTAPSSTRTATSSATCPLGRLSPSQILGVVRGHWGSKTTATGRWTWCSARTTRRCVRKAARR